MHLDIVWPGACLKIKLRCQLFQKFWGMKTLKQPDITYVLICNHSVIAY